MSLHANLAEQKQTAVQKIAELRAFERFGPSNQWTQDQLIQYQQIRADIDASLSNAKAIEKDIEKFSELERLQSEFVTPANSLPYNATAPTDGGATAKERRLEQHKRALRTFIGRGAEAAGRELKDYTPDEAHALLTSTDALGGFLVPDPMADFVAKDLAQSAMLMNLCRQYTTNAGSLIVPTVVSATAGNEDIYSSGYTGAWTAEAANCGAALTCQDQPTFGQETIEVFCWQPNPVEITTKLLEDSSADLEQILAEIIAETYALDIDAAILNGTGTGEPEGVMVNAGVRTVISGAAAALTYDGLVNLYTSLPSQYHQNAVFVMQLATMGEIMKLQDGAGSYVVQPWMPKDTLFGKPVVYVEFMPDAVTAANEPVLFGDFRHYGIVTRRDLRVQRLGERFAPNIGVLPTARLGGRTLRPNAFSKQVLST